MINGTSSAIFSSGMYGTVLAMLIPATMCLLASRIGAATQRIDGEETDVGLFDGQELARALSLTVVAMAAAPGFSPLLGGALNGLLGWRATFIVLASPPSGDMSFASVEGDGRPR